MPDTAPENDAAPELGLEVPDERRARHCALLQEIAALGMAIVRAAAAQAQRDPTDRVASLTFARAANAVRQAIALEQRITAAPSAGTRPPPGPKPPLRSPAHRDPRRASIRNALREAVSRTEPDRTVRTKLFRAVDECLDAALTADSNQEVNITRLLYTVADDLEIPLDESKLSDHVLGMPPRKYPPPHGNPAPTPGSDELD